MMDPSQIISFLSNTKTLITYGFELKGVSAEARNAKDMLEILQHDLNELKRLSNAKNARLDYAERLRIERIICGTNTTITHLATPVKRTLRGVEKHGTVLIHRRIIWTIKDGDTIRLYMPRLEACQRDLLSEITILRTQQKQRPFPPNSNSTNQSSDNVDEGWDDDTATLAADPADIPDRHIRSEQVQQIHSGDLEDNSFWEDWLRNNRRTRLSTQSSRSNISSVTTTPSDGSEDFTWLREEQGTKKSKRKHRDSNTLHVPEEGYKWLRKQYDQHEKDDGVRRSRAASEVSSNDSFPR